LSGSIKNKYIKEKLKMKTTTKILTSIALISSVIALSIQSVKAQTFMIGQNSNPQNISINGLSGGKDNLHGCGYLSTNPNQIITLQDDTNFMSVSVLVNSPQSTPTLFIIGENTNTQFCAFQDDGQSPVISGLWPKDTYSIYVGDRNGGNYDFTLTINSGNNLMQ
jgi:hypothetical protein